MFAHRGANFRQTVDLNKFYYPAVVAETDGYLSNLNYFDLNRKSYQFSTSVNGQHGVGMFLDIGSSTSWAHASSLWSNFQTFGGCREGVSDSSVCYYLNEAQLDAGHNLKWKVNLWLDPTNRSPRGKFGVVGANNYAGFYANVLYYPHGDVISAIVHGPSSLPKKLCKDGYMYRAKLLDGEERRVIATVGVADRKGSVGETVLSTRGSIELARPQWQSFVDLSNNNLAKYGESLRWNNDLKKYQVACKHKRSIQSIGVRIGDFDLAIPPSWFVDESYGKCVINVEESNGPLRLGPSFLRNVVTHFNGDEFGVCLPADI